jgi:isoaspartyl peptidase/L-asparaginase-like protein (Ntn-hydrolase superfamily)
MVIAVHGGAGRRRPGRELDVAATRADLAAAAFAGWGVLEHGGAALDAVQAAVVALEDCPRFNAGRGAVLNARGEPELDAAIMDGTTRRAGAVAAVMHVRNPVVAARAVLERSEHVLLVGVGAEAFAREAGAAMVDPGHHVVTTEAQSPLGTVGAVALDAHGALAAATSTGGKRGQLPGRVGDSPLVGAGTYADTRCAVSATGDGDAIMRAVAAHDVAARVRETEAAACDEAARAGGGLEGAAQAALREVTSLGDEVGLLAVDARGAVAMPFAADVFHRAFKREGEAVRAAVGGEEPS